ncbi:MAG: hypothetical protein JWN44_4371 [Myxococcales bacterium]|nr:hypothetical protein [Myxococcales bacterium]
MSCAHLGRAHLARVAAICALAAGCSSGSSPVAPSPDLATAPIVVGGGDLGVGPRSCDERVRAGALARLTLLAVSTPADDTDLAVDASGRTLAFLSGGALMLAPIDAADPHTVGPASVVTIGGGLTLAGGSFTGDGAYWFAASTGGSSQIYRATLSGNTATVGVAHFPATNCAAGALASPLFAAADETRELFVVAPLTGCAGGSWIVSGALDRHLGAFAAAIASPGWRAPSLVPGDLTLVVSTTTTPATLAVATRGATDVQFGPARPLMLAVGDVDDRQLAVDPTCKVAYLVSRRDGGRGGYDLWVADL